MTAEIAIFNSNGIALAADSAVSIGDGSKVYNSVNKLFSLSKNYPVAVMIYNGSSLLSIPWEVVIKQCRKSLGTKSFDTLQGYADYFWKFAKDFNQWFKDDEISLFIKGEIETKLKGLVKEITNKVSRTSSASDDKPIEHLTEQMKSSFLERINQELASLEGLDFPEDFDLTDIKKATECYKKTYEDGCLATAGVIYQTMSVEEKDKLYSYLSNFLIKTDIPTYTGIVIAGFGEMEMRPEILSYKCSLFINDKLCKAPIKGKCTNNNNQISTCGIYPFAQDDVVLSFLNGIDPQIQRFVEQTITALPTAIDLESAKLSEDQAKAVKNQLNQLQKKQLLDLQHTIQKCGTNPILQMLMVLPKDELAEMAESLINLTAFKRRMSSAHESVGGPIDVAIISKGDGLIWSKRKHYFSPELNQHFFHNYFQEQKNDC